MAGYPSTKERRHDNIGDPAVAVTTGVVNTGAPLTNGLCRSFVSDIATTISFVDAYGNSVVGMPVVSGYNPVQVQQFDNLGGAAIFALY